MKKRINKSKERILYDMKKGAALKDKREVIDNLKKDPDFIKKMKFTKEEFYPKLIAASNSIDDAKMFVSSISNVMMSKFLSMMKEKKFSDLNLTESLEKTDPKYEKYVELLNLFNDMNVFDARTLWEGMNNEINTFINDEMKNRTLDTLKTKWIDELV